MRVFPLSNWTELDVWQYIHDEDIAVVPLYFARKRRVVRRSGTFIMVDDDRMVLRPDEIPETRRVRFRTLGCYPLTGAIDSQAATVADIVSELRATRRSERQGRLIDSDETASMERKKRQGYF
jgi:sulfate adenylyltransferase subunit 2